MVRDICKRKLGGDLQRTLQAGSNAVILGALVAYILGPVLSRSVAHVPYDVTFAFVFVGAALLGAAFPILSEAVIDPNDKAGEKLSYLYLSNIIGSALGSFLVGFVIMDHLSTQSTSLLLLGMGFIIASVLATAAKQFRFKSIYVMGCAACFILMLAAGPLFSRMYERLLFKGSYDGKTKFTNLVENHSGVIAVGPDETVFGGGVYDGHFNTDLVHDSNGIFRAYAIAGLNVEPAQVLVIGLSSGSWAQVLANHPAVQKMTVVEINPGYLPLIRQRSSVSSLLRNPKVDIVIDDGRRWLLSNPNRKFDFILMNTTYHWRANISNLLSTEFLALIRSHLRAGGIAYYNTTWAGEVQVTGSTVFPYALRISNFLAVSDSPITFERRRWETALLNYRIDGRPVVDLKNPMDQLRLNETLALPDAHQETNKQPWLSTESRDSMLARLRGVRLITDDNMGTEWK